MPPLLAYIALGSNLGDRARQLALARERLAGVLDDLAASETIETAAVDRAGRPDPGSPGYLNAVVRGWWRGSPRELLQKLAQIEVELGRDPREKGRYLPRSIDLDILILDHEGVPVTVTEPDLAVPHPRLKDRPFLRALLGQLANR